MMSANFDATVILKRLSRGDTSAADELFPLVYDNLRAMAGSFFRDQPSDSTLEPTALVHEAYVKLVRSAGNEWASRAHFMAVAAKAMRQILQDRARLRRAATRGGGWQKVSLSAAAGSSGEALVDVVAIDDALSKLAELDERQYRIVELRFFAGLDVDEVAEVLKVSKSTVEKEWMRIRAWLSRELADANE
jgi:RNA polymerase sigma factor (TIGR02999 family)